MTPKTESLSFPSIILAKVSDFGQLVKLRLTLLVLFSAVAGYILGANVFLWTDLFFLMVGGFLVTGSSNAFNQIIEKETDKLMDRTANRPLPSGRMMVSEAFVFAALMGITGVIILWFFLNPLSGLLGSLALLIYVAIYTPLKKISPIAVFVGAFPGAIPPLLGWVAATGKFGVEPGVLFAIQFIWQFIHFWALAWKLDGDYKKAGFRLLPSAGGKNKSTAFQILVYSCFLVPAGLLPLMFNISGYVSAVISILAGGLVIVKAVKFYFSCDDKDALKLMIAAYLYLPVILLAYVFDKV